jgi:rhodanese-related sulfurtransferase
MRLRRLILLVLGSLLLAACAQQPSGAAPTAAVMSVADLKAKLDADEGLFLLDVRTPQEFSQDGRVAQATLIPLQELEARVGELPTDTPIACICRSGNRSNTACALLAERGMNVANIAGGMLAWKAAGYPVE